MAELDQFPGHRMAERENEEALTKMVEFATKNINLQGIFLQRSGKFTCS